jgi:hypothetical protein
MIHAVNTVAEESGVSFEEFTITARKVRNRFIHHWYLGCDDPVDPQLIALRLDEAMKELNDDYATERKSAISRVEADVLPLDTFYGWMKENGKLGGQHKFPRVLKGEKLKSWKRYLQKRNIKSPVN